MIPIPTQDDILAENLLRRGVLYLSGSAPDAPALDDIALVAGLVSSANARVRHGLAAWMLAYPEAHPAVPPASATLEAGALERLRFIYSAAVRLQALYAQDLKPLCAVWVRLPDYFGPTLTPEAQADDPARALAGLAQQQATESSALVDWEGTYRHIARGVIRRLGKERSWAVR